MSIGEKVIRRDSASRFEITRPIKRGGGEGREESSLFIVLFFSPIRRYASAKRWSAIALRGRGRVKSPHGNEGEEGGGQRTFLTLFLLFATDKEEGLGRKAPSDAFSTRAT